MRKTERMYAGMRNSSQGTCQYNNPRTCRYVYRRACLHDYICRAGAAVLSLFSAFLLALAFALSVRASADPVYTNPDTGFAVLIEDEEDLLSDEEVTKLADVMEAVTEYGNAGFVSGYADSSSTSEWARDTYIDYFGNAGGTMFVIDMRNRNLYIINRGSVKDTITSAYSESITDNVYTYATGGDYYTCAEMVFTQELTLLQGGRISQPMKYITAALVAVVLAILVNFIFVRLTAREVKPKQSELFDASIGALGVGWAAKTLLRRTRHYVPHDSGGGGFSGGGGGSSGSGGSSGGGGGGGFSGGGHSF